MKYLSNFDAKQARENLRDINKLNLILEEIEKESYNSTNLSITDSLTLPEIEVLLKKGFRVVENTLKNEKYHLISW